MRRGHCRLFSVRRHREGLRFALESAVQHVHQVRQVLHRGGQEADREIQDHARRQVRGHGGRTLGERQPSARGHPWDQEGFIRRGHGSVRVKDGGCTVLDAAGARRANVQVQETATVRLRRHSHHSGALIERELRGRRKRSRTRLHASFLSRRQACSCSFPNHQHTKIWDDGTASRTLLILIMLTFTYTRVNWALMARNRFLCV